jgi:hypothetical protein
MAEGSDQLFINWRTGTPEQVGTSGLADGSVTTPKLADSAVTTIKIADGNVTNIKLADMAEALIKGRAAGAGTGPPQDLTAAQVLAILGGSGFSSINIQSFTTPGANTYTPTAGMKYCIVISTGGGGGGGGCDSDGSSNAAVVGGGAGGTCIEFFSAATIGASVAVNVGAAGLAGAVTGTNGGNGGDTTFGAFHTAGGGPGGTGLAATAVSNIVQGVVGGTATGGTINISGGESDFAQGNGTFAWSSAGGSSFWGGGPRGQITITAIAINGIDATVYGTGGSGAVNINQAGGASGGVGMSGICVVIEFI